MADLISILPQQLVFGLALGTVYGLIALGYTMVYGVLQMINFAHGEVFMIGAYIGWSVFAVLIDWSVGGLHPLWVLPVLLAPAMLLCGGLGMTLERLAYRPLYTRGATRLGPLISAVGASIFLQNFVMLTHGRAHEGLHDQSGVSAHLAVQHFWRQRLGIGDRHRRGVAAADVGAGRADPAHEPRPRDPRGLGGPRDGDAVGIDANRVVGLTFFLGSALAGAAGVLVGLYYTQIDFVMGYSAGLKAFTAAVLGGIGNIKGAMLGGLLLGVIESLASTFINPAFKDVVAFAVLILTLVFKPEGILGEKLADWKKI